MSSYVKDIYAGFGNMQEIFLLSMLIGGIGELMRRQGGLTYLTGMVSRIIGMFSKNSTSGQSSRAGELGIAALVNLTNLCTANNTVAIIVSGSTARELAEKNGVSPRRSASMLDIFSCVIQGILPYGAQTLLIGSVFALSPLSIVSHSYYSLFLAAAALAAVFLKHPGREK